MATVRKLKGDRKKPFALNYTDNDGKRRQESFHSMKAAHLRRREVEQEIDMGVHIAKRETVTVGEAAEAWFDDCVSHRELAGGTLENYRRSLDQHILPALGKAPLGKLKSERIQRLVDDLKTKHAYAHVAAYWILKDMLRFAAKRWRCGNPFVTDPIKPPRRDQANVAIPTRQEIRDLLEAVETPERRQGVRMYTHEIRVAVILLAILAGLRKGEIAGLQWENLDFVNGVIKVRYSWSKGLKPPKTKAGRRDIPMSPLLGAALERVRERADNPRTGYVFAAAGRRFYNNIWYCYFRPALRRAGLVGEDGRHKFSLHSLRHVAGSLWIERGVPLMEVARMMGHANANVTLKVYAHLFEDRSKGRAAIEAIERDLMPKRLTSPGAPKAIVNVLDATPMRRKLASR